MRGGRRSHGSLIRLDDVSFPDPDRRVDPPAVPAEDADEGFGVLLNAGNPDFSRALQLGESEGPSPGRATRRGFDASPEYGNLGHALIGVGSREQFLSLEKLLQRRFFLEEDAEVGGA